MAKPIPRYGPVSTRARAAGFESMEDGDFLLREDVVRWARRRLRTERERLEDCDINEGADVCEALLASLGVKP